MGAGTASAYPKLSGSFTATALEHSWTPDSQELARAADLAGPRPAMRLMLLLHWRVFRNLQRFESLKRIALPVRLHVAAKAGIPLKFANSLPADYVGSRTEARHIAAIRRELDIRVMSPATWQWLRTVAESAAETKHHVVDIENILLEELVTAGYELPGQDALPKVANRARTKSHDAHYAAITASLTDEAKRAIDAMLEATPRGSVSGWQAIKRDPAKPTNAEIRNYLVHLNRLKALAQLMPPIDVPALKLTHFRYHARSLDIAEINRFPAAKRYALAAIFVRWRYAQSLDHAADIFIRKLHKIESIAKIKRIEYLVHTAEESGELIAQLKDVLFAYRSGGSARKRVDAITASLHADIDELIERCNAHTAAAGRWTQPFLVGPYAAARPLLLNCLRIMKVRSATRDAALATVLEALLTHRDKRPITGHLPLSELGLTLQQAEAIVEPPWSSFVYVSKAQRNAVVDRKYFELAVLMQAREALKCGDVFVPDGETYDDYREELVSDEVLNAQLASYGELAGIEIETDAVVAKLKTELASWAREVDARFPKNAHAQIIDGRLSLKRPPPIERPPTVAVLDAILKDRMPQVSIIEVLIDAVRSVKLTECFRPLSGGKPRIEDDPVLRLVITLVCYGCNLGATQVERSIKTMNRRKPEFQNLKWVTEQTLKQAIELVINAFAKYALPKFWGNAKSVSADGTTLELLDGNLLTAPNIRHGVRGGIAYFHVSDQYIAIFNHFHACSAYEGTFILDVIANRSDIQPDTIHGDTHAQSFAIFGLSYLLGFKLMPRIRNPGTLHLFYSEARERYTHIDLLFAKPVDWSLVKTHWHELLRVAVSIRLGRLRPSTILRRLGTYSRANKVGRALRELGKAVRTIYLLQYFDDASLRATIHAQVNKSEQWNDFLDWVFFGNGGKMQENVLHEQRKVIGYQHLVGNLIALYNVEHMSRVLSALAAEGLSFDAETLGGISPYRKDHINRFGDYALDHERPEDPFDPERSVV